MHKKIWSVRLLALTALAAMPCTLIHAQVHIKTDSGIIEGSTANGVTSFKGIPYAAPPVGNLRWRPPQPPVSWKGVRDATKFGPSCMQIERRSALPWTPEFMVQNKISEDCLYLNVWTPRPGTGADLPVIMFIHGGGFNEGSGSIKVYRGGNLAAKGVVVVTINYRLGALGFLALPELTAESRHHSSGNYALLDQIAALKWIRSNIAQFGGNPHNVTIWGQSAGAFSVAALIASPLAKGLFEHAQADSGIGFSRRPMMNLQEAEQAGLRFEREVGANSLKQLRAMSAASLVQHHFNRMSVDGWVLPDSPQAMNAKGTDNDVPVITGYNTGDAFIESQQVPETLNGYQQIIQKRYGDMAAEFEKLYPVPAVGDIKTVLAESSHDRQRVAMFLWASIRVKNHDSPVYTYYFDRAIPWPQHPEFGAFHTSELTYFFLNLKALDRPWKKIDFKLSREMSAYLVNFASHGDPDGPGLVTWPKVSPSKPQTMELGARCGAMPLADKAKVAFWTRYYNSSISDSAGPF